MRMNFLTCLCALAMLIAACSDSKESVVEPPPNDTFPGVSVTITPDTATLEVGDTIKISYQVLGTTNANVSFRSSNTAVATVSNTGVVKAIAAGTALITATSAVSAGASDGTIVSVRPLAPPAGSVTHLLPTLGIGRVRDKTTSEVAVAGSNAYTGTWGGEDEVYVWDALRATPELIQAISMGRVAAVSDIQVTDDQKWVVASGEYGDDAGIAIFSRLQDGRLQLIGRFRTASRGGAHTFKLTRLGGKLYAFLSAPPVVQVVDITDPANTRLVHSFQPSSQYTHDVYLRDGLLFTADWDDGLGIWDIGGGTLGGSPLNPKLISRVRTVNGSAHNVWWMQDQKTGSKQYVFVGEEGPGFYPARTTGDVHVVDITDITKPKEVAFLHVDPATTSNLEPAGSHNFSADEQSGILYAAFYNGGVRAIDGRGNLSDCTARQKSSDGRCDLRLMGREIGRALVQEGTVGIWGVVFQNNRLYAADMLNGLWIVDAATLRR